MKNEVCGKCEWSYHGVCEKFHMPLERLEACSDAVLDVVPNKEESHEGICEPDPSYKKRPGRKKKGV